MPHPASLSPPRSRAAAIAVTLLAIVLVIFGVPILVGGVWLIVLGGSWYYAFAGLGLLATAYSLFHRSMAAVWVYLATFVGTVIWAFWEVGFNWWAQVPRLVAPTLILVLVLATIPTLRRLGAGPARTHFSLVALMGAALSLMPMGQQAQAQDTAPAPTTPP